MTWLPHYSMSYLIKPHCIKIMAVYSKDFYRNTVWTISVIVDV
jgi:hypothetical protein